MRTRRAVWLVAGVIAIGALVRCSSVPLTAPGGSNIWAQANPPFVIANGGTAVVTALITMPNGNLVHDGTNVYFFTDIGRVDDSVQTRDGMAHANFVSDSRSGTAHITIWSGGAAPANNNSTTTTTTPGSTTETTIVSTASGTGSATVSIAVGSALAARVVVTANPDRITTPRHATIVANVFDASGNPVQNVPVIFSVAPASGSGAALEETLASGGIPQYTDSNGQAFDQLNTRALNGTSQKAVTVTASLPTGSVTTGNTVDVYIDYTPASAMAER